MYYIMDKYLTQLIKRINKNDQRGGADSDVEIKDKPSGGFPNIYTCDKLDNLKEEAPSKPERKYETHKTAIKIQDIMKSRRNKVPIV